ncbi:MAG: hypothetical protein HY738_24195, partial [Bacteroidia bacterium]|nr:hypothetical protein [Bacteroidia bacterium]
LKKYIVNYINLRGVLIYNFKSFLDVFFQRNIKNKAIDILDGITINLGFFSLNIDEESILKENAFKLIEKKLLSARNRGKQPIIIVDEIQLLKNIRINGEGYLIDELFNLFVRLTKEIHTAHIVLSTSDSYFIEEIYNSSKLKKATKYYFIDHFSDDIVSKWLKKENLKHSEIEIVLKNIGGCPWELQELIRMKKENRSVKEICDYFVNDEFGKIYEFVRKMKQDYIQVFYEVIGKIVNNQFCCPTTIQNAKILDELLCIMIAHDFWFYKVDEQKITANSISILRAFERLIIEKNISEIKT